MANIKHMVTIDADASEIFKAVTTQDGLSNWWTDDCEVKPELGFVNEFNFDGPFNKMKVINIEEGKRVDWECVDGDTEWNTEWLGTTVSFEIIENEGYGNLRFRHNNWEAETDYHSLCSYHWGRFMVSLKSYLETGVGQPYKSEKVNNN